MLSFCKQFCRCSLCISLFTCVYKKMPRICKYIQSFTRVCSVKHWIRLHLPTYWQVCL
jgi:hypothetical protein